jgi:hypothetical protein
MPVTGRCTYGPFVRDAVIEPGVRERRLLRESSTAFDRPNWRSLWIGVE